MKHVIMAETFEVSLGSGSTLYLSKDETFLLTEDIADQIISADLGADVKNLPTCPQCLKSTTCKKELEEHLEAFHPPELPEEPKVEYPALETLNPEDPEVQTLSLFSERQLKWIAAQIGVTALDLKPEGEDITREEWIAAIIRSQAPVPVEVPKFEEVKNFVQEQEVIPSTEGTKGDSEVGWGDAEDEDFSYDDDFKEDE